METKYQISIPPDFVFKKKQSQSYGGDIKDRNKPENIVIAERSDFIFDHMEYPENGQLAWFKDCPFPQKGHPFPAALYAIGFPKRVLVSFLKVFSHKDFIWMFFPVIFYSKKKKAEIISRFLTAFVDSSYKIIEPFILAPERYSFFCRELRKLITSFLVDIGINNELADNFSEVFITLIEYDNAYRLRAEDILSETTKEKMTCNPRKEMLKLVDIMFKRSVEKTVPEKYKKLVNLLGILLYIPSYKKAFRKSMESVDFTKLQLDEADRYHVLLWGDYNYLGKPIQERISIYNEYHLKHPPFPPRITITTR